MALKPNDGQIFLKEVDEELRKEQLTNFFTRYGWWIIAAVVLILGATGGWLWWSSRQASLREETGQNMVAALEQLETGGAQGRRAAAPAIGALAESEIPGYRAAALFARANSEAQAGNNRAAIASLRSIAEDQSLDQPYRDAALVRRTQLEFDALPPQEVIRRLGTLAGAGNAWQGTAGELVGVAHLKMNRPDLAGPIFVRIARDEAAPESLRARARHMAGSLGFDISVTPPTSAARPAAPAAPAPAPATREKAR